IRPGSLIAYCLSLPNAHGAFCGLRFAPRALYCWFRVAREYPPVGVGAGEQLFVAALVYQPSAAKHEDAVVAANLAGAAGDQEGGPTFHDAAHGALDLVFGRAVDGAGRVVEDEDPRIGQERASDGDTLALPPGEGDAPLADLGLVAIGQGGDELMGL